MRCLFSVFVLVLSLTSTAQAASLGRGYFVDATDTYPPSQGHISQFAGGDPPDYWFVNLVNFDGTPLNTAMFAPGAVFTIQEGGGGPGGVAVTVLYSDPTWGDGVMLVQISGGVFNKGVEVGLYPGDVSQDPITGDPPPDSGSGDTSGSGGTDGGSSSGSGGGSVQIQDISNANGYMSGGIAALSSIAALVLGGFFAFWLVRMTMRSADCIDGECRSYARQSDHELALYMNDLHDAKVFDANTETV